MIGGSPLRAAVEAKDLAPPPQPNVAAAWCDARTTPGSATIVLVVALNLAFGSATFLILSSGASPDALAMTIAGAVTMPGLFWLSRCLLPNALSWRPLPGRAAFLIGALPVFHVAFLALGSALHGSSVQILPVEAALLVMTGPQAAAEEFLFRLVIPVLLARWLGRRLTPLVAGIAGVLFVVAHVPTTPASFLGHLAFGLFCLWLFVRCRTIWVPALLHSTHNLVAHAIVVPTMWAGWPSLVVQWSTYGLAAWALLGRDSGRNSFVVAAATPTNPGGLRENQPLGRRLPHFDVLRAFALLVIVIENLLFFLPASHQLTPEAAGDRLARALIGLFIEYRGLPLFCLLLGFGVAMAARGDPARLRTVATARGAAFVVVGVLHGALLFSGDILLAYGVLLMLLHRLPAAGKSRWGLAAIAFLLACAVLPLAMLAVPLPVTAEVSVLTASATDAGTLRLAEWYAASAGVPLQLAGLLLPTLVGHATGRTWLAHGGWSLPAWLPATLVLSSIALCLPHGLTLLNGWGADDSTLAAAAATWLAQLGGLVGALGLWCWCLSAAGAARSGALPPWFARLAGAGTNTLTGYLLASLLMAWTLPAPLGLARLPLALLAALACLAWAGFVLGAGTGAPGSAERALARLTRAGPGSVRAVVPGDPHHLGDPAAMPKRPETEPTTTKRKRRP